MSLLHRLPPAAQQAILASLPPAGHGDPADWTVPGIQPATRPLPTEESAW
jgi:hypothetical protein